MLLKEKLTFSTNDSPMAVDNLLLSLQSVATGYKSHLDHSWLLRPWFTYVALRVYGWLLWVNAGVGYFNDMLQLSGLLLNFCCQEQRSLRNDLKRGREKNDLSSVFTAVPPVITASANTAVVLTFLWNLPKEWII